MRKLAVLLFAVFCEGAFAAAAENLLAVRVPFFEFHGKSRTRGHVSTAIPGSIVRATLALGVHANVRICVEELAPSPPHGEGPIEISVQDKTVGEILERMVGQDPRYLYRERLGVIEVIPVSAEKDPSNCLNAMIPSFHVYFPWSLAWAAVRCEIAIASQDPAKISADPLKTENCSGGFSHLARPPEKVLEATFEHSNIRQILDQLSSMAGNVAWYSTYKKSPPSCENLELGEYQPKTWYPPDGMRKVWVEGLPQECLSCHYHKLPKKH